jgi:AraC family transcriptional regulator
MQQRTLGPGEFFGACVASRQLGRFALSVWKYDDAMSLPWHAHESSYVTFVMRGRYRERVRATTRACGTRAIITHSPGEVHADEFAGPAACLCIEPEGEWPSDVMQTATASSIGDRLIGELRRHDSFSPLVVEGLMLELFAEAGRTRDDSSKPAWLSEVRQAIACGLDEKIGLTSLARDVNVHPAHLARTFRRAYGRTIGELLRESRIEKAKEKIVAGVPLCDVAAECGFADQSHLTRTFRRITGLTPSAFRNANRIQDRRTPIA